MLIGQRLSLPELNSVGGLWRFHEECAALLADVDCLLKGGFVVVLPCIRCADVNRCGFATQQADGEAMNPSVALPPSIQLIADLESDADR